MLVFFPSPPSPPALKEIKLRRKTKWLQGSCRFFFSFDLVREEQKNLKVCHAGNPHVVYLINKHYQHDNATVLVSTTVSNRLYCFKRLKNLFRQK